MRGFLREGILECIKTTVDIPNAELKAVMKWTGAKTKREAIVTAIADYNRRAKLAQLASKLGTFDDIMTLAELRRARESG